MRSNQQDHLDKVNFIEYTKLPGIINDRLHFMFTGVKPVNKKISNMSQATKSSSNDNKASPGLKAQEHVTEKAFTDNLIKIFAGDLDSKMKFTFEMYDFDQDGLITPEDIRIMMSYMPFQRNVQLQNVQGLIERASSRGCMSPMAKSQQTKERTK